MILTLFRGRIKVMSTIALHWFDVEYSSETVRQRTGSKGPPTGNDPRGIKWSNGHGDRWRQTRDTSTLREQYL